MSGITPKDAGMDPKDIKFPRYSDSLNEWKVQKNKMMKDADETSIMRWGDTGKVWEYSPKNRGKEITDNNPYLNIVDQKEYDDMASMYPYPSYPKGMGQPETFTKWFGPLHKQQKGDPFYYMRSIGHTKNLHDRIVSGEIVPEVAEKKEEDLQKLKEEIGEMAEKLGMPAMGVTKVDRRHIADERDDLFPYDTLVIFAHEMPMESVMQVPHDIKTGTAFDSYMGGGNAVVEICEFIRSKGYRALHKISFDGQVKFPQHAVNAGMGNYSTYGICITPEVGTRTKLVGLIIDADLPLDKPKDFNIEEFCSRCRMCQKSCPSGAIPKEEGRMRGTIKRQANYMGCMEMMKVHKECMRCVRVCPFSVIGYDKCMESLPQYYMYNTSVTDDEKVKLLANKGCE